MQFTFNVRRNESDRRYRAISSEVLFTYLESDPDDAALDDAVRVMMQLTADEQEQLVRWFRWLRVALLSSKIALKSFLEGERLPRAWPTPCGLLLTCEDHRRKIDI